MSKICFDGGEYFENPTRAENNSKAGYEKDFIGSVRKSWS
jgi:hypothetical protein